MAAECLESVNGLELFVTGLVNTTDHSVADVTLGMLTCWTAGLGVTYTTSLFAETFIWITGVTSTKLSLTDGSSTFVLCDLVQELVLMELMSATAVA